jgi:DNA-binding SARP family transcriptional activator/tetratricopeptide (TPR) repeat protein
MRIEFRILGPIEAWCDGVVLPISSGRQRTVLAMLLLRANRVVTVDDLAEALWGSALPPTARVTVQNYVKRLRDALGAAGTRIVTQPPGYLMRVATGELDAASFEVSLDAARKAAAAGAWEMAGPQARAALSLWRGDPLTGVPSQYLALHEVPRLAELREQAAEIGIEAALRLGRAASVTGELRRLVAAEPLRERLSVLLMAALYEDGRQAEALTVYQQARDTLIGELGVEPGQELRDTHQRILAGGQALPPREIPVVPTTAQAPASPQPQPQPRPRQLPAAVGCFTGRAPELAALNSLLGPRDTMPIPAICGTGGAGKTALAVQWAHQAAGRFPDGQLYVNLRGYDCDQPVSAAEALAGFLRALGVPGQDIPDQLQDRARLYRSRLAGLRVLVLLDNASGSEQVRPLLPGDPGCMAVVTSRDALAGLVAVDGARRLDLDVLPLPDAIALLTSLIGPRAGQDPGVVADLAGLCARLPLALRIAAELAAARPSVQLADLVAELAAGRLDGLDGGEDRADVRAVLSWSFRRLPGDVATAFTLIGLHPGADFDVYAAAALAGITAGPGARTLSRLHRASLVQAAGAGRYSMHDLLRAYAREQAATRDTGRHGRQALTRLFDYYLGTAAAAMDILFPAEAQLRPRAAATSAAAPDMPDEAAAHAWLDAERANLVAAVRHCAAHDWPGHATGLAGTLFRYLMVGSHLPEAHTIYLHVLQAARLAGDLAAEADALTSLGGTEMMRGHFRDAGGHYRAALECYQRCGHREGEARVLRNLGMTEYQLHNCRSAVGYHRQAIAAYSDVGDSLGAARALVTLAEAETELGSYDQASEHLYRALPVVREASDHLREAEALELIGWLSLRRGQLTEAAASFGQVLEIYRRIDYPTGMADALRSLGEVSLRGGEYQRAIDYLRQALAMFRKTGHQHGENKTLRTLAEALHGTGQPADARVELTAALRLAAEAGNTYELASLHRDLAESHHSCGQDEQARRHWQQALTIYTELGAAEADQVRSQLSPQD